MSGVMKSLRIAGVFLLVFTVVTGVVYPSVVTGVGQVLFRDEANGSLIVVDGRVVGCELIGQQFEGREYFWSRPSMTGEYPYNVLGSVGSNKSPAGEELEGIVAERVSVMKEANPSQTGAVPVDLVTASASGLDPHISVAAAEYQAQRVADARGMAVEDVMVCVKAQTEGRTFGFLGEPRVNVVQLNLMLDAL